MDELLHIRSYLNEGGKVLYTGEFAGHQYTQGHGAQFYDPTEANARCNTPGTPTLARCLILYGSPSSDLQNDVIEYWFGAFLTIEQAGFDDEGNNLPIIGTDDPFTGTGMTLNGGDSADNQFFDNASFISTSGILPLGAYPQFESWVAGKYDRPGGPFEPHSGNKYAYSQIADQSFKRFTHTVNVPVNGGNMSVWTSYNTEADWDMVFVEAHTVGQDDWTTLEDMNGHTTQSTGESCKPENGPGVGGRSTRSWTITRRSSATIASRTARRATGGLRTGAPAAGSSGTSTSPVTTTASSASRSRSRSPT
jgi:hypothetical protein